MRRCPQFGFFVGSDTCDTIYGGKPCPDKEGCEIHKVERPNTSTIYCPGNPNLHCLALEHRNDYINYLEEMILEMKAGGAPATAAAFTSPEGQDIRREGPGCQQRETPPPTISYELTLPSDAELIATGPTPPEEPRCSCQSSPPGFVSQDGIHCGYCGGVVRIPDELKGVE